MRTVILVPRRDDGGWRDELWRFCRARWERHFPEWLIFEGYHTEGPFNRSAAVNTASELAGDWDLALIIDSDTISDPRAIRAALAHAEATGTLGIAHDRRYMMNEAGTRRIMSGYRGNWTSRRDVQVVYRDSVSCAVAVRRDAWEAVGGFDERFVGWGFEDTAFHVAVETVTGLKLKAERADCFHLWHPLSPEASKESPTYSANHILKRRYLMAHMMPEQLEIVMERTQEDDVTIPLIIHRTVPAETSKEVERYWKRIQELHPAWDCRTYREPIDPADWPILGDLFDRCDNGAQKAGLIRLEALFTHGGIYVDSDCEPFRPLDPLVNCRAFAAWEDEKVVPDAVLGSVPQHPAFKQMMIAARDAVETGQGAWKSGPGVTTAVLPGRDDVLLLPPGSFYPAHYLEKGKLGTSAAKPWVFLEHKWAHSWASPESRASIASRQRAGVPAPTTGTRFALCMPWRDSGDDWRRRAHDWCVKWWTSAGFEVFEGPGSSRSEMCNNAAELATTRDPEIEVLVFVDADTWTQPEQVVAAVERARETGRLTHAYTSYAVLGSHKTQLLQRRRGINSAMAVRGVQLKRHHVSGACAVPVALWREIGGFDERFVGWGFEDQAFNLAAGCLGGGIERIDGHAVHWYHRDDPTKSRAVDPTDTRILLMEQYCRAACAIPDGGRVARLAGQGTITIESGCQPDPEAMRAVLAGVGGPLAGAVQPAT